MCLPVTPFKIEREWEHAGLKCAVVMQQEAGIRCGYVRVPPSHLMYGTPYDEVDVQVHGGLTFAEQEPCIEDDGQGWWFGFDCGHAHDLRNDPDVDISTFPAERRYGIEIERRIDMHRFGARYRSQAYVERETEHLAEQLAAKSLS